MKINRNSPGLRDVRYIPEAVSYSLYVMAEGGRSSSCSESDSDSLLSGSVCYSTEFSDDHEKLSEAPLLYHGTEEVHPYLFEPERSSSTQKPRIQSTIGKNGSETQTGTWIWLVWLNLQHYRPFQFLPAHANSSRVRLLSRTRQHYIPSSWRPNPIGYHAAYRL